MLTLLLSWKLAIWCPDSLEVPAAQVAGLHQAGHDVDDALRLDVDATLLRRRIVDTRIPYDHAACN